MVAMATRAAVVLLLLSHHSTSLTLDGGAGWEVSFSPPVLAAGHINTTLFHESGGQTVQMVTDSLAITCLFFAIEPFAKHVFSPEQYYGHGPYSSCARPAACPSCRLPPLVHCPPPPPAPGRGGGGGGRGLPRARSDSGSLHARFFQAEDGIRDNER
eukprot:COSAG04_NODE_2797_length_3563_cov_16.847330_2_plen_157_part_00